MAGKNKNRKNKSSQNKPQSKAVNSAPQATDVQEPVNETLAQEPVRLEAEPAAGGEEFFFGEGAQDQAYEQNAQGQEEFFFGVNQDEPEYAEQPQEYYEEAQQVEYVEQPQEYYEEPQQVEYVEQPQEYYEEAQQVEYAEQPQEYYEEPQQVEYVEQAQEYYEEPQQVEYAEQPQEYYEEPAQEAYAGDEQTVYADAEQGNYAYSEQEAYAYAEAQEYAQEAYEQSPFAPAPDYDQAAFEEAVQPEQAEQTEAPAPAAEDTKAAATPAAPTTFGGKAKAVANKIFIDGLSGMATGLFATLIIGTIIGTIGGYIPAPVGTYVTLVGKMCQCLMGAGIGLGVAIKFKESPLVTISAAVCGMIGSYAKVFTEAAPLLYEGKVLLPSPGEPLGAFIAALVGIYIGHLVAGKTKVDIIVTPLVTIATGGAAGIFLGPYVSAFMTWLGSLVNWGTEQQPLLMGIVVSVLMGIFLTLPISSAAIGVALGLNGITAGAATIGCCCNMIGFAVISYRENKVNGLIAQGLGTSMLQMPNIIRNPRIWLPSIISSAILGPVSTCVLQMTSNAVGSGMGTAGLVGPISTFTTMIETTPAWMVVIEILVMYFLLPAAISLGISELMRKRGWIKAGDMKLDD